MEKSGLRFNLPHPLVLLSACILIGAFLSYVLPAGEFARQEDNATGRTVVVAGTYTPVERSPVGLFDAVVALPRGMARAADVIFLVFLIGGAFTVIDESGALRRTVSWLAHRLKGSDLMMIPIVSLLFAVGGAVENMQEEIIALVPVLLLLCSRVGFPPLVAVAISAGPAFVASAFSPINPFQVQIAQKLAELPLGSGALFRLFFLALALILWIGITMRYAAANRIEPQGMGSESERHLSKKDLLILGLIGLTFAFAIRGMLFQGWGFDELSAAFFVMGVVAGLVAGMGFSGTAEAYIVGFRSMAFSALLIGFARSILVVLEDGRIIDTIVNALFTPLEGLPQMASAVGMIVAQAIIHVPVPSMSGQAVLTMPVLVPLSDLLGMSRQITVLAYQYGAGLTDLMTPTNGALMAILGVAAVRYEDWLKFALPLYLGLVALGALSIVAAVAIGL